MMMYASFSVGEYNFPSIVLARKYAYGLAMNTAKPVSIAYTDPVQWSRTYVIGRVMRKSGSDSMLWIPVFNDLTREFWNKHYISQWVYYLRKDGTLGDGGHFHNGQPTFYRRRR